VRIHLEPDELTNWSKRLVAYLRPLMPSYVTLRAMKLKQGCIMVVGFIQKFGKHEFSIVLHCAVAERGRSIIVRLSDVKFLTRLIPASAIVNEILSGIVPQYSGVSYSKRNRQLRIVPSKLLKQVGISIDARILALDFNDGMDVEVAEGVRMRSRE